MVTKKCLEILSSGGVIIYPTDTVYGIGCDATNLNSISKINEIKNRKSNTPLICLMNGLEMVKNYVTDLPEVSEKYLLDSNEPTTVIFSESKNIDSYPKSIAIRITWGSNKKTLSEDEITQETSLIISGLERKLKAILR